MTMASSSRGQAQAEGTQRDPQDHRPHPLAWPQPARSDCSWQSCPKDMQKASWPLLVAGRGPPPLVDVPQTLVWDHEQAMLWAPCWLQPRPHRSPHQIHHPGVPGVSSKPSSLPSSSEKRGPAFRGGSEAFLGLGLDLGMALSPTGGRAPALWVQPAPRP